jgi:hypothetical protein
MGITVDSRKRDPKSENVVKYYDIKSGQPMQYKPVRKISPDRDKLSPLAQFIVDHAEGKYIGGMMLNGFLVRVEGCKGSQFAIEVKEKGIEQAEKLVKIGFLTKDDRATIRGWLFPVFEPDMDETEYFNKEAARMVDQAGSCGRIIIGENIYNS